MTTIERDPSHSPTRRASWSRGVAALGAKFGRVLGDVDENNKRYSAISDDASTTSTKVEMVEEERQDSSSQNDRSVSRGRETFQSSGRGGAGNIRRSSASKGPASPVATGRDPDLYSPARGREPNVDPDRVTSQSAGRGGMGNIRSSSRARATSKVPENHPQTASIISDVAANNAQYERNVIQASQDSAKALQKSGRGGIGNITKSRSRSRARGPDSPAIHSTGRGGRGNWAFGTPADAENVEIQDEFDRMRISQDVDGVHSTGRGGLANMTRARSPPHEGHQPHPVDYETLGRGGAGNIIRSRSASRDPSYDHRDRSASKDRHGIAKIWSKVSSRAHSRDVRDDTSTITEGDREETSGVQE